MSEADLVAASTSYFVGSKLTRAQVVIISTLFVFVSVVMTYASFGWINRAFGYVGALGLRIKQELKARDYPLLDSPWAVIMAVGIIACLKFMWDVRRAARSVA